MNPAPPQNTNRRPPSDPEPSYFQTFCDKHRPAFLEQECKVDAAEAEAVGQDILIRARHLAALDQVSQEILLAPFLEEAYYHQPDDASPLLKAAVILTVRNSRLEDLHVRQLVRSSMIANITAEAAAPLSHLLAAHRQQPPSATADNQFANLAMLYPRAWACLAALIESYKQGGGRWPYRSPHADIPTLPAQHEHIEARMSTSNPKAVVASAIDERFDQRLIEGLRMATKGSLPMFASSLSRFSRNSHKLMRVIEFLLAHDATMVTTNYMLRTNDVWLRRGDLVRPNSHDRFAGLTNTKGLSGVHGKVARQLVEFFEA